MNKRNFINGTRCNTNRQSSINLAKFYRIINNLQRRIFVAKQQGHFRKMRKLQKLLLTAHSNRLLAVYRVCNIHAGKLDPSFNCTNSIERVVPSHTFIQLNLLLKKLKEIHLNQWKPTFNKIIYSSKSSSTRSIEFGDLTVVTDQALQTIVKTALEAECKPIFKKSCYKLTKEQSVKEQSVHDAIQYTRTMYESNTRSIKNWVVKVSIKKCFELISQDFLTKFLHSFPAKRIIHSWLNIVIDNFSLVKTQNNMIKILFATIVFNHIKNVLNISNNKREKIKDKNTIVHYRNEFIVTCKTKEDALQIRGELYLLLNSGGLDSHSIVCDIYHITEGFNFLGFNIRLYRNRGQEKLIIKPSKESVLKLKNKLKKIWIESNGSSVDKIIKNFNPIISKWTNYFKIGNSSKIFKMLDHFMYCRQRRFTRRAHSNKSYKWIQQRYWRLLYLRNKYKWVFGCKETGAYMSKFTWTKNSN